MTLPFLIVLFASAINGRRDTRRGHSDVRKALLLGLLLLAGCAGRTAATGAALQPAIAESTATGAQISAVVRDPDNQAVLRRCYERALKSAGRATNGRVAVTVFVGPSGSVQRVALAIPPRLEMIGPCIRSAISRWTFPTNSVEYGAQFPLVLQSR
jgi:hypothetical protein